MSKNKIKNIAILTSGGDSAGMNSAVKAVVYSSINKGIKPFIVYEGYKGLVENNIKPVTKNDVKFINTIGGTSIYSERFPQFADIEVRKIAVKNLKQNKIDALVVVGGDGSYMGASKLTEMGIATIGLPGTIDNDIATTDWTIGFWSALQIIVDAVEAIRATAESHNRAMIVEVMGRHCGDLALYAAIATGAEVLSISEKTLTEEQIISQVKSARKEGHRSIIIIVTEHLYDTFELAKKIEKETGIVTRGNILGNTQRGAKPEPADQILATEMGVFAVNALLNGKTSVSVNIVNGELKLVDILKTVKTKRKPKKELIEMYESLK